jgi:hypothetical protein
MQCPRLCENARRFYDDEVLLRDVLGSETNLRLVAMSAYLKGDAKDQFSLSEGSFFIEKYIRTRPPMPDYPTKESTWEDMYYIYTLVDGCPMDCGLSRRNPGADCMDQTAPGMTRCT